MGEMSAKVLADARREPPIQCLVSTSTPATLVVLIITLQPKVTVDRSDPNGKSRESPDERDPNFAGSYLFGGADQIPQDLGRLR